MQFVRSCATVLVLVLTCGVAGAAVPQLVDRFSIDATFHFLGRQEYPGIGQCKLVYTKEPDAGFRVQIDGNVGHPQDAAAGWDIKLVGRYKMKGNSVQRVSLSNTTSMGGADLLSGIERVAPFMYLVQALPTPPDRKYTLTTPHGTFALSYAGSDRAPEVIIRHGTQEIARFYVERSAGQVRITSFRIIRPRVSLNFHTS